VAGVGGQRVNVTVRVERLVLEGFDLTPAERGRLAAALEAELGRQLAEGGLDPQLAIGGEVGRLAAPPIEVGGLGAEALGRQIAGALGSQLVGRGAEPRR
jgi:hypothetical protein